MPSEFTIRQAFNYNPRLTMPFLSRFRSLVDRPYLVRPWALAGPILVLLVCLPVLRPLNHPDQASDDERLRLATIRALVHHRSLALDPDDVKNIPADELIRFGGRVFSAQPPAMAVVLSFPAWLIERAGVPLTENAPVESLSLAAYLLTLLGVTMPVALATGMIYRMGRLFELSRPRRMLLALACVFATGLLSYAVVLNPHAPAASLLILSAATLIQVETSQRPRKMGGWILLAGLFAGTAAVLDPAAAIIGLLLATAIAATRFSVTFRVGGVVLFLIGCLPAVVLHAVWTVPVAGNFWPSNPFTQGIAQQPVLPNDPLPLEPDDAPISRSVWLLIGSGVNRILSALFGMHGLLTHFPIVVLGFLGIATILHRHWPTPIKFLAFATAGGSIAIVLVVSLTRDTFSGAMFANRWFVVFVPLLVFWSGAWLRNKHTPLAWTLASTLLIFSTGVTAIGITDPYPRKGYEQYTVGEALMRLIHPTTKPAVVAARR